MNKKMKRISIFILTVILTGLLALNVSAASKIGSAKVNALYKSFLKKSTATVTDYRRSYKISLKGAYFTTADIDGNGIKELIIKEKLGGWAPCQPNAHVFTVKNKKVVYVGCVGIKQDYSNTVRISKKYKAIYNCYGVASYCPTHFFTIKNYKLFDKIFFYEGCGADQDEYAYEDWCKKTGYYINKKKVSKSKYDKEYKKYMDSLKVYTLSVNTSANRNKKLK